MKAYVHEFGNLKLSTMPEPLAGDNEVVVKLRAVGLNRRDLSIPFRRGKKAEPLILGSDGAGVIEAVGNHVTNWKVGDEVIINPSLCWFSCSDAPPNDFDILGMPDHGTFAEKIALSCEQIERKPKYLTWEEAGVVALSALTGYRALFTKGKLRAGETVFIPGAGSGVATFIIQLAKRAGAKVITTSRSEQKRMQAIKLGADIVLDTASDWQAELNHEQIDLVIESVGAATFNRSLDVLKKGGKIVVFGATTDDVVNFDLRKFFYGQYQLLGSTMGSREELRQLLQHMEACQIHPVIDRVFLLNEMPAAFDYLKKNNQFGKLAIQIN